MNLPRLHLFELEDQPWFPIFLRDLITDYLHFVETRFSFHLPVVEPLAKALKASGVVRIIDLCAGGAGPMSALQKALLQESIPVRITLTDLYPNLKAFEKAALDSRGTIDFFPKAVNALRVPAELVGFRTMFNAFHHFQPADAVEILKDAVRSGQPIGIFEIPHRSLGGLLPFLFLTPLLVWLMTPFIRPWRWDRFIWTYLIPLVPLACWWDGVVSAFRAYTVSELEAMARKTSDPTYQWQAGEIPIPGSPAVMTYLIGWKPTPNSL